MPSREPPRIPQVGGDNITQSSRKKALVSGKPVRIQAQIGEIQAQCRGPATLSRFITKFSTFAIATADEIPGNKFSVRVHCDPCPNVARTFRGGFRRRDVLLLRVNKGPRLIDLYALSVKSPKFQTDPLPAAGMRACADGGVARRPGQNRGGGERRGYAASLGQSKRGAHIPTAAKEAAGSGLILFYFIAFS
jgi:hypothetical protein